MKGSWPAMEDRVGGEKITESSNGLETDRQALLAFKSGISSDPQGVLGSWNASSSDICIWSGVICGTAHPRRVVLLILSSAQLGGELSPFIANLTSLRRLDLGDNQLVGTIPVEIFNLRNLQLLALDQNMLMGIIPSVIGNLDKLVVLTLSGNNFSGQIPPTIGNLFRLNRLYLGSNGFSGNIPASLGNCKQLDMLNLSFNSLQGTIPSELMNSTSLVGLDLSNNNLAGSIPLQVGALLQLLKLDISFNNLSGQLPPSLGNCVQLSSLILRDNMLNGTIPQSFSDLKSIELIDLSRNYFVGQIPEFFANMVFLEQLDLSINIFEGPIPTGGIFQNHSAVILDGNAGLCASATTNLFQFPVCTTTSAVKNNTNALLLVKVIPPIAIALFSFIFFMVTLLKRRQAQASPYYNETMKKVSYGDIVKATNWFSPVNKISSSRTGSIYIGRFEFDTDLVAIKLFHLEENAAHNSFLTECEVLRNTRHRNIVKAVTVCSTVDLQNNEFKAIVFDFMANGSLDMWVHPKLHQNSPKRALSFSQRLKIAMDVALALDYMHNQLTPPLIHCDLKPGNVLLDYDMTARVGAPRSLSPHCTLILFFTHLLIFLSSNTAAQSIGNGSEIDIQALLSFKSGISSDPHGVLGSWKASTGLCRWPGVACGTSLPPRVVSLNLSSSHLSAFKDQYQVNSSIALHSSIWIYQTTTLRDQYHYKLVHCFNFSVSIFPSTICLVKYHFHLADVSNYLLSD
uniref:Uncharacterized protein n=1 Tax=Avena sativa TaxID=4498 RepID=A0ACD5WNF4_AVESA